MTRQSAVKYTPRITVRDGHTLLAQTLKSLGITHAYCVSGTPIQETFAKCFDLGIRPIGVRHQQAGVMMAIAQNYIGGRPTAVAILSAGPAVTNAATGILVAHDNCWPVVVLGGRRPLSMRGMGSFQELDGVSIYRSITKWSALVESTSSLPAYIERAFEIAMSGRPGPVYLDLPEDVLNGFANVTQHHSSGSVEIAVGDTQASQRSAEILLQAERPAIIIGKGVRWSEPLDEMKGLTEGFGIPFITSPMGRGFLPDDHPLCFNQARGLLQSKADAILLVGARLDWTFRFGSEFAGDAKLIQIDIHKPEIGINRSPAVGIVGDVKAALRSILTAMHSLHDGTGNAKLAPWHAMLANEREKRRLALSSLMNSDAMPMSPHRMFKEIRNFLPRDAICVLDGNVSMAAGQQVLPAYVPASRFTATNNGCLGVGIPFAIGAKLACPERFVISICGDAAVGFSAMEMETAVRHKIAVIVVVANNDGISGALTQKSHFAPSPERVTMFQPDIHYDDIAHALGGHGEFVDQPEQLRPALERATASGQAACINVRLNPLAPYPRD